MCMYVCMCSIREGQKRVLKSPRPGVTGACEPQCGCWQPNSGSLEEEQALLATKPSLAPSVNTLKIIIYV